MHLIPQANKNKHKQYLCINVMTFKFAQPPFLKVACANIQMDPAGCVICRKKPKTNFIISLQLFSETV